ncbi:putative O-glycosylation ligase, exosortase A system-associated [Sphingobium aquiterrae]|uniref:putative O-glycosylation ligase, exosortase A system-associated n=1 Tax=Sphingobium aquiterrae TaxID=2038656 RepID=UPI00301663C6
MRDLFFMAFLGAFFAMGLRRSFLFVLVYAYIDIVSPQRLSYILLNSIPISAIAFAAAAGGWLLLDDKSNSRFSVRQLLMLILMAWCAWTTAHADFPVNAASKWNWVWRAMIFAVFLPLTLRTRLRIEALALVMILCASSIIVTGGIKTILSGGGYGVLNLMIDDNTGLYEGSTISMVSVAIIPLILWLANHGTIFPPERRVTLFAWALCFACLLIPIGTQARTGLICILLLAGLSILHMKRRILYGSLIVLAGLAAIPFLPTSFTQRMETIQNHQSDESASTRIAVWNWTLDYVKAKPTGGGFDAYLGNSFRYEAVKSVTDGGGTRMETETIVDKGRAFHSAYFEMLGEQGYPGFLLWALIHGISLARTEWIRRHYRKDARPDHAWIAPLATALQQGHLVYLVGALFVGIAYQPFVFMLMALQIGLDTYLTRKRRAEGIAPFMAQRASAA